MAATLIVFSTRRFNLRYYTVAQINYKLILTFKLEWKELRLDAKFYGTQVLCKNVQNTRYHATDEINISLDSNFSSFFNYLNKNKYP